MAMQYKADIEFDGENVSAGVSSLVVNRSRATVAVPASFAELEEGVLAGSRSATLTVNFFNDWSTTSAWRKLNDAYETDSGEMEFSAVMLEGVAVGPTNPVIYGVAIVNDLDIGGTVNEFGQQSKTFPIKPGTLELDFNPGATPDWD